MKYIFSIGIIVMMGATNLQAQKKSAAPAMPPISKTATAPAKPAVAELSTNSDSAFLKQIYTFALTKSECYANLNYLCKSIGPRLTGSANAERATTYCADLLSNIGLSRTYKQPVTVPHWVRGEKESAIATYYNEENLMIERRNEVAARQKPINFVDRNLKVCALGGSVSTPVDGIRGKVVEVKRFSQLDSLGKAGVEGKIVFYNSPMDATRINTFEAYGPAVQFRGKGATQAAKYGAVASVIRSVASSIDDYPHTGAMRYDETITKIPGFALSTRDAEWLSKNLKSSPNTELLLKSSCKTLPDTQSSNVIGEWLGTENPNEYIVVGGHLDSWDLAEGAHDDGAGVVQSIEALRILKNLGYKPKHSIRCVLFMNEENGLKGGIEYANQAKEKKEKHMAAIETDAGGFAPRGFACEGDSSIKRQLKSFEKLFKPYNLHSFEHTGGGADISRLKEQGCPLYELEPESQRYFDVHHSGLDVFESVNKRELELGAASLAALIYLLDQGR